jgi:hypothetical protein
MDTFQNTKPHKNKMKKIEFSAAEQIKMPGITGLKFHEDLMDVELDDGRTVSVPVAWIILP